MRGRHDQSIGLCVNYQVPNERSGSHLSTGTLNFEIRPRVGELRPVKVRQFSRKLLDLKLATRSKGFLPGCCGQSIGLCEDYWVSNERSGSLLSTGTLNFEIRPRAAVQSQPVYMDITYYVVCYAQNHQFRDMEPYVHSC